MSNNLCEAPMKRRIRVTSLTPRGFAYLGTDMIKPRWFKVEPVLETSIFLIISKRRYGMKAEGSPAEDLSRMKSKSISCKSLWLLGYKPCSSGEGATGVKITGRIHKTSYPELGCSGNLNPSETVHLVNTGTSYFDGMDMNNHAHSIGLAAVDVKYEGRNSRSSLSEGKPRTWRRAVASCRSERK